jgi:hypothetical protein
MMISNKLAATLLGLTLISTRLTLGQALPMTMGPNDQVPAGFHEFELFGNETLYLSHYPMFGSIHSYQVLLEVTVRGVAGSDVKKDYLALRKSNPSASYSVSPEKTGGSNHYWVLPGMVKAGKSFQANLHWQQGSSHPAFIAHDVTVEIVKVIHFRLFHPEDAAPEQLTYLLFGKNPERYIAHYIGSHPDFDQILSVSIDPANEPAVPGDGTAIEVTVPGRKNKPSLRLVEAAQPVVGKVNGGAGLNFRVSSLIHYEPGLEIQK